MKLTIEIDADTHRGVLEALWAVYGGFQKGALPICGSQPASRGERYSYDVLCNGYRFPEETD
jgi:hypothetical protein